MRYKIEIIENSLIVTDTILGSEIYDAPKNETYYNINILEKEGVINIYNLFDLNKRDSSSISIPLANAIDSEATPFNIVTFKAFSRANLGFKAASGGSGALQIVTGDGTTTIDLGSFGLVNFQFGAYDEVFTFIPPSKAGIFVLKLTQDSVGSRTVTFPANVKFTEGIQPTLSTTPTTGTDIITFYFDGVNFLAVEALNFI